MKRNARWAAFIGCAAFLTWLAFLATRQENVGQGSQRNASSSSEGVAVPRGTKDDELGAGDGEAHRVRQDRVVASAQSKSRSLLIDSPNLEVSSQVDPASCLLEAKGRLLQGLDGLSVHTNKKIADSLAKVERALRDSEKLRTTAEVKVTGGSRKWNSGLFRVAPPTPNEISQLEQLVADEARTLPPTERLFFRVRALRMVQAFTSFEGKTLVLLLDQTAIPEPGYPGQYRVYLTEQPELFRIPQQGDRPQDVVPRNATAFEFDDAVVDGSPSFRYSHFYFRK